MRVDISKGNGQTVFTMYLGSLEKEYEKPISRICGGLYELKDTFDDEHAIEVMEEVADLIERRMEE